MEFRLDAFNALNHRQFNEINATFTGPIGGNDANQPRFGVWEPDRFRQGHLGASAAKPATRGTHSVLRRRHMRYAI
jgi:hypothetical protein